MIQENEKTLLRQLVHTPTWEVMLHVAEELKAEINSRKLIGDTNEETLKNAYDRESGISSIKNYLQRIIDSCQ